MAVGGISSQATTLTQMVQNLDGMKDSTQIRGSQQELHVRSGFEAFKELLSGAFRKSQSNDSSEGIRNAITREYGQDICNKVMSQHKGESITAGTLRAMHHDAQVMKLNESLNNRVGTLTSEIPRDSISKDKGVLTTSVDLGGLYKAWSSDPESGRAQQVLDNARSFAQSNVKDVATFSNLSQAIHNSHGEDRGSALQLAGMISRYQGTPAFGTMQAMSSTAIDQDKFTQISRQESQTSGQTNLDVMSENLKKMEGLDDQIKAKGVGSMAIGGAQAGMRIGLLQTELAKQVNEYAELARDGVKQENGTFRPATPEELKAKQTKIDNVGKEIAAYFTDTIDTFKSYSDILQNPELHKGLSEDSVSQLREMGQHYGQLALAFSDPQGPIQGLISLAMVASADPMQAHGLMHPVG